MKTAHVVEAEEGDDDDAELSAAHRASVARAKRELEASEGRRKSAELQRAQEEGRRQLALAMAKMNMTKITLRYEPCDDPEQCLGVKCAIPAKWLEAPTPSFKLLKFFTKTYNARRGASLDPKKLRLMLKSRSSPLDSDLPIKDLLATEGLGDTIYVGVPPRPDPCAHLDADARGLIEQFNRREIGNSELTSKLHLIEIERKKILGDAPPPDDDDDGGGGGGDAPVEGPASMGAHDAFDFDDDVL